MINKVKIGEPNCPVASAERGRRVQMEISQAFQAADHDFTNLELFHQLHLFSTYPLILEVHGTQVMCMLALRI